MTLQDIEDALATGLQYVQKLAPLAALGGPAAAAVGSTVGTIAADASAILAAVENDAAIIAGGDLDKIRALEAELRAENAKLADQIAQS